MKKSMLKANPEMKEKLCVICGLPESEHHTFTPPPPGCICDHSEWINPQKIPPVCGHFEPADDDSDRCRNCEHDKACHGGRS